MPKQPHPADAFNAAIIASAVQWSAFTQAGGRIVRHAETRGEAEAEALLLANEYRRPALVYAIDSAGRSAVAATINPSREQTPMTTEAQTVKTYASRFSAQRGARKLLGEDAKEGEAFRSFKTEDGKWDFETLAAAAPAPPEAEPTAAAAADEDDTGIPSFLRRTKPERAVPVAEVKAAPAEKPAKPAKAAKAKAAETPQKRAAALAAASRGELPAPPDFSAPTHARFRKKLEALVELAKAGDIKGLEAAVINPVSSSPKALDKYRNLAVIALKTRAMKKAA